MAPRWPLAGESNLLLHNSAPPCQGATEVSCCALPAQVVFSPPLNANKLPHGFTQEASESQNRQAQTPETDEGKPSQEAFALQELAARFRAMTPLRFARLRKFSGAIPHRAVPVSSRDRGGSACACRQRRHENRRPRHGYCSRPAKSCESTPEKGRRSAAAGPLEFADALPTAHAAPPTLRFDPPRNAKRKP